MPGVFRFDVLIPSDTGLPSDTMVNTWHFEETGAPYGNYDNVRDMLADFYNLMDGYMAGALIQNDLTVKAYDLAQPEPRVPVYEGVIEITPAAGVPLPSEVALVLSIRADYESGTSSARRRNRKYIGPIVGAQNAGNGRPTTTLVNGLCGAASDMLAAAQASVSWTWVVYSPTDGEAHPVIGGWVDDSWDTQRRRGLDPTSRTTWNVIP